MKILLDTQAIILAGQDHLPTTAKLAYTSTSNDIYFSLASLWEIGIKAALGKLKFERKIEEYFNLLVDDFELIPLEIKVSHIEKAVSLPFHHKDPFDRLIIGQSLVERATILGSDGHFDVYGCKRIWE